jgi:sugar phosphate isomerase/epimerase
MKIGMISDSLATLSLDAVLDAAAGLGIERLEFAGGNWSSAPHLNLDRLLDSAPARAEFLARLKDRGIAISALNCSGNPLHPGDIGARHREVTRKTIALAGLLDVGRVVMMSGCPGGPGDANANWVTTSWPPETQIVLQYQWEEVLFPYWRDLAAEARGAGVDKLCLELHGHQNVYSVGTFFRLRDVVGETVGVNFDPSHLMWMGADPLAAIAALGPAIYHVHAKDTRLESAPLARDGRIEIRPAEDVSHRAWNYVTLGHGHDLGWWRCFCQALIAAGYDDVLSIEHEDFALSPLDGVRQSVELLRQAMPA